MSGTQSATAVRKAQRLDVPFLALRRFADESAFAEHAKNYEAYASLRKDDNDCIWFHLTLEPSVREMLVEDYGISFPADTAKGESEATAAYAKRRDESFKAIAGALLKELAVEGVSASTETIAGKCRWNPPNRGKLKPYATMHKALFREAIQELHADQQTASELVRLWLSCFAHVGSKDLKRYGEGQNYTGWLQYSNRVIEMSTAIDSCDHFRVLLGVSKKRNDREPKIGTHKQQQPHQPKNLTPEQKDRKEKEKERKAKLIEKSKANGHEHLTCSRCGRKGHIAPNCFTRLDPSAAAKKPSQPPSTPTSPKPDSSTRREKTFREGSRKSPRFAASAIKKMSGRTLRALVNQAFGDKPSGKAKSKAEAEWETEGTDTSNPASESSDESEE